MTVEKINGLTQKPHPFQIISYFFFAFVLLTYFVCIFPLSSDTAKVIGAILEAISGAFVLASGYLATTIDPSDPYLKKFRQAQADDVSYEAPTKDFYCRQDHTHVMPTSKHCKRCGRCTEGFDHHCKWINNDIGKANYKEFFVMISSVMVFLGVYLIFGIVLTVSYINDSKLLDHNLFIYDHTSTHITAVMVVVWVFMALSAAFLTLDTNLVLFHMYLSYKGLTTFQYITAVEERKEYERELEYAIKVLGGKRKTCLDFVLCLKKKRIENQPVPVSGGTSDNKAPESMNVSAKDKKDLESGSLEKMIPFKSRDKIAGDDTQNEDQGETSPKEKPEINGEAIMIGHSARNTNKDITPEKTNKHFENESPILKDVYETQAPMVITIGKKGNDGENAVEVKKSLQKIIDAPIMSTTPEIIKNKHLDKPSSKAMKKKANERLSLVDSDEEGKKENAKNSFNIFSNPGSNLNNSRAMAYSIDKLKNENADEKTPENSKHVNILDTKGMDSAHHPHDALSGRGYTNLKVEKSPQSKRDDTYPDDIAIETFRDAEKVL